VILGPVIRIEIEQRHAGGNVGGLLQRSSGRDV
jgi:hypothetical protein